MGIRRVSGYGSTQPVDLEDVEDSDFPPINQRVIISMNLPFSTSTMENDSQVQDAPNQEPAEQSNDLKILLNPFSHSYSTAFDGTFNSQK